MPEPVTAEELLTRTHQRRGLEQRPLTPDQLEHWLVSQHLAERTPGGLVATAHGQSIAVVLEEVNRDVGSTDL